MSEKSILEQALLQVNNLEEAVKQNAKGILHSVMKEEISDLLKESLEEEEKNPMDETPEEEEKDMSDEEETADDEDADTEDAEDTEDLDNDEAGKGIDDMDSETDTDDETSVDDTDMEDTDMSGDDEMSMDDEMGSEDDEDVMDMTDASDDEVIRVFKAMKPEDGIVVKKDGNKVEFKSGDDEYIIKLDDEESEDLEEEGMEFPGTAEEEETLYEIELNEEEEDEEKVQADEEALPGLKSAKKVEPKEEALAGLKSPKKVEPKEEALAGLKSPKKVEPKEEALAGLKSPKKVEPKEEALAGLKSPKKVEPKEEEEMGEAARTKSNVHGDKNEANRAGLKSKKMYKAGSGTINEEVETLRKQNSEYKKALVLFKEKLNEVAVFNANLAYATRLFTEHSTTKTEKLNILKRFDTISTLSESKNLYNSIKSELGTKTTVTETVVDKITSTPSTSSSQEVLAESKAYENPQFARMKDLMKKIK